MLKIWHISDTHGQHELLDGKIPSNIDVMIHSGDATNHRSGLWNFPEMRKFLDWYGAIDIPNKIYVAGNHDVSVYNKQIVKKDFEDAGIIYLEMDSVIIDGVKFYGIPYTPTYGDWVFMVRRDKISNLYDQIQSDSDVLISHGPPKGVLDLSYNMDNKMEFCGCKALKKYINSGENSIKYNLFGHIHSVGDVVNTGLRIIDGVTYSNASVLTDSKFANGLSSYGNIIDIQN